MDKAPDINKVSEEKKELQKAAQELGNKSIVFDKHYKVSTEYTHLDGKKETIALDLGAKLQEFVSFYQKTKVDLPSDFEVTICNIWEKNQIKIEKAVKQNGFNEMLIIPGNIPLTELKDKMTMGNGYYAFQRFDDGGGFAGAVSQNADKFRLILVHKTQNLNDRVEFRETLYIKGKHVKLDQTLTLEDYLIFQRKYFEETGKHLDEDCYTWLATKSGARLVNSRWDPDFHELLIDADDLNFQSTHIYIRPSRCFL